MGFTAFRYFKITKKNSNLSQKIYNSIGMPNGYSEAMQIFTKILKLPLFTLHQQGFLSVTFVDDSYLESATKELCIQNIDITVNLLQ